MDSTVNFPHLVFSDDAPYTLCHRNDVADVATGQLPITDGWTLRANVATQKIYKNSDTHNMVLTYLYYSASTHALYSLNFTGSR